MSQRFFAATENLSFNLRMNIIIVTDEFILMFIKPLQKTSPILKRKLEDRIFELFQTHEVNLSL